LLFGLGVVFACARGASLVPDARALAPEAGAGACTATVTELRIPSRDPGVEVFVQRARAPGPRVGRVVLTHGAGSGGSATWDLPGEHSVLRHLACAGFDAYGFDARGFGGSTRLPELKRDDPKGEPVVRAREVQADLQAVVDLMRRDSGPGPVDLMGWSWGCVVAGLFAAEHPSEVRRLALVAPVWDRRVASRHITDRIWREESRALHRGLTRPGREDPVVHDAFVEALFRFEPGDVLRLPNGPYRDLYGPDAPIWNARAVTAEVLIIRGEHDGASKRAAALRLFEALANARGRAYVEVGDAGHFLFRRVGGRALRSFLTGFLTRPATVSSRSPEP
jgi:pimeloyl-ACP methyl ester carboxylesterase